MVALVQTAVVRQENDALFGEQVVQLELAELDVGPGGVAEVVKPHERGLDARGSVRVQRRHEAERDVLVERPEHQEVDAGEIEAGLGERLLGAAARGPRRGIHELFGRAFQVELRRRDRKSTRLNSSHGYISYAVFCLKKKNN